MIREEKEIERGIRGGLGDGMRSGRKGGRENVANGKNRRGGGKLRKCGEVLTENRGRWKIGEEEGVGRAMGRRGSRGRRGRSRGSSEMENSRRRSWRRMEGGCAWWGWRQRRKGSGSSNSRAAAAAVQWRRQHDGILVAGERSGGGRRDGGGGWTPSPAFLEQPLERENTPFFLQMTARVCGGVPSPLIEPIMSREGKGPT